MFRFKTSIDPRSKEAGETPSRFAEAAAMALMVVSLFWAMGL